MFNRSGTEFGEEEKKEKNNLTCKQNPLLLLLLLLSLLSLSKDEALTNTSDPPKPDMSQAPPTPTLDPLPQQFQEAVQMHAIDYELPLKKKKRKLVTSKCQLETTIIM